VCVDRSQMSPRMRIMLKTPAVAQGHGDRARGAVPAGRNADAAVPETGTLQIITGLADAPSGDRLERRFARARGSHADGLPAVAVVRDAGLVQGDPDQHGFAIRRARREQRVVHDADARAPGLAPGQAATGTVSVRLEAGIRAGRLGRPDAPGA